MFAIRMKIEVVCGFSLLRSGETVCSPASSKK
jgi:hypothetical protein